MRILQVSFLGSDMGHVSSQVLSVLQFHALSEPLLPNLRTLRLSSSSVTEELIPFLPLFLSARTTAIDLVFLGFNCHTTTTASMIMVFPTLCPDLHSIRLISLPKDPMITIAVSKLVLNAKQHTIREFLVDSPLTGEAYEAICKHPHLCGLRFVIDGRISLPIMELPNLTRISIEFHHGHHWLEGFRGSSFGKLVSVTISSDSSSIGHFLEAFEKVAVTTSIPETLSEFRFENRHPWRPNYRSLLPFTQLVHLVIQFSCELGCSSTIDDDIITDLAQAMPKLELIQLGDPPCETRGGVSVKGLAALACHCPRLLYFVIHFQVGTLNQPEIPTPTPNGSSVPREGCALRSFHAGDICVPEASELTVALTLLRIFPCLEFIAHSDQGWTKVLNAIRDSKPLALS